MLRLRVLGASMFLIALLAPTAAYAQEERFELFGGFSYLFADVDGELDDDVRGAGFAGEFAFSINDWLGVGAEVGYNSGDLGIPAILIFPAPDIDFTQWTLMFGPRFRIAESERFAFGAQAMAGMARLGVDLEFPDDVIPLVVDGSLPFDLFAFDFEASDTTLAAAFGVHFDLRVHDRVIWRVIQPDLMFTGYADGTQAHFRIFSGLGVRF